MKEMDYTTISFTFLIIILSTFTGVHGITLTASRQPTGTLTIDESQFFIRCSYTKQAGEDVVAVEWKRKRSSDSVFKNIVSFPVLPSRNISYVDPSLESRTTATRPGSNTSDQATLAYSDVKCSDKAEYQCSVSYFAVSLETITSNVLQINSLKSKSDFRRLGQLTYTPASNLKEGDVVMFTCEGDVGSEPPAELAWYMYKDGITSSTPINLTPGAVTSPLDPVPAECRFNRTSKLNMTLTSEMNNMVIRCTAQQDLPRDEFGDNDDSYHQTEKIPVFYAPKELGITSVPSVPQGGSYSEGLSRLTLSCSSRANPSATFYWMMPDMNTTDGATLVLENLTVADTSNYTCVAYNEFVGLNHTVNTTVEVSVLATTTPPPTTTSTTPTGTTRDPNSGKVTDGDDGVDPVVIIVPIVVVVVVIIVIIVVICICKNRKKNKDRIEEPPEKPIRNNQDMAYLSNRPDLVSADQGIKNNALNASFNNSFDSSSDIKPRNEDLHYIDVTFDDKPRSRRPIQLIDNSGSVPYADIAMPRV